MLVRDAALTPRSRDKCGAPLRHQPRAPAARTISPEPKAHFPHSLLGFSSRPRDSASNLASASQERRRGGDKVDEMAEKPALEGQREGQRGGHAARVGFVLGDLQEPSEPPVSFSLP